MRRNRRRGLTVEVGMLRRALALLLLPALLLGACGDDDDDVEIGSPGSTAQPDDGGTAPATFEGTITEVTTFEPVAEGCTPPEDLDPEGSVSSDDPPICTDPAPAPLGSTLVEVEPGVDGGEKVVFTIGQDTALTRAGEPIGFGDLRAGDTANVAFDGQVAESYPGQARADHVDVGDAEPA